MCFLLATCSGTSAYCLCVLLHHKVVLLEKGLNRTENLTLPGMTMEMDSVFSLLLNMIDLL